MENEMTSNLDTLTTFELSELILHTLSVSIDQLTLVLTFIFAYFTVGYLVGKKLSKFQLYSVTLVYSGVTIFGILIFATLGIRVQELVVYRDGAYSLHWMVSTILCFAGWVLSILFMMHSRK
ncbi:MAG: hypothetical protein ACI85N_001997 [Gammaproteobacteria bacterium]|jgi:hypothetical protein